VSFDFDGEFVFLLGDNQLDFLCWRTGFTNLDRHVRDLPVDVALVGGHQLRTDVLKRLDDIRLDEIDAREDVMIGPLNKIPTVSGSAVVMRSDSLIKPMPNLDTENIIPWRNHFSRSALKSIRCLPTRFPDGELFQMISYYYTRRCMRLFRSGFPE
jgi:hypothetical protein